MPVSFVKHKARNLVVLVAALFAVTAFAVQEPPPEPQAALRLSLSKLSYAVGEPLEVTAYIQNIGTSGIYVFPAAHFGSHGEGVFALELQDSEGKPVPDKYVVGAHFYGAGSTDFAEYVKDKWIWLAPGQLYGTTAKRFQYVSLRPGKYTLRAESTNPLFPWQFNGQTLEQLRESAKKLEYPPLMSSLQSNIVTFTVRAAQPNNSTRKR
jgi:hypothetical protein